MILYFCHTSVPGRGAAYLHLAFHVIYSSVSNTDSEVFYVCNQKYQGPGDS